MNTQALNSSLIRKEIIDIPLNHSHLYEDLRDQGQRE